METKKIKFLGFWDGFCETDNIFYNILSKHFNIEFSDNPDYLFSSPFGKPLEYARYDCVRIMFTGESTSADFGMFDYSIDFDYIDFLDRHCRYPLCLYNTKGPYKKRIELSLEQAKKELASKEYFCNFIFGHNTVMGMREKILEQLSKYKRVECPCTYLNNMPNGKAVFGQDKHDFVRKCKFTIAVESMSYTGFIGEKITHAYENYSIPIYYGNDKANVEFNEKSFINCHSFNTVEDAIEHLIKLDSDDDKYLEMLMQPMFVDSDYPQKKYDELERFLVNIFSQPKEKAFRRMRWYHSASYETNLKISSYMLESKTLQRAGSVIRLLKQPKQK